MDLVVGAGYEIGPIRPPSEAYSLLVRITRNCPWNQCLFCHTYKGSNFEVRSVEDVKRDIDSAKRIYDEIVKSAHDNFDNDIRQAAGSVLNAPPNPPNESYYNVAAWLYSGGENVFLQDGNSLVMPTAKILEILNYLKANFPGIKRITSYARSQTLALKTIDELKQLHEAGLSRLHVGLETGYDALLQYMKKGVTAAQHIQGGKNVVASGISLCCYVLLGLGGKTMWREHALETARVLSEINPDYIRVRTLTITQGMPLFDEVAAGRFLRSTDEDIAREERLLIENLNCTSNFVSDHTTNLFQEIEGQLPENKGEFLEILDKFLALSAEDKMNFEIGRRLGIYAMLSDMQDEAKYKLSRSYVNRFVGKDPGAADQAIWQMMERFI